MSIMLLKLKVQMSGAIQGNDIKEKAEWGMSAPLELNDKG